MEKMREQKEKRYGVDKSVVEGREAATCQVVRRVSDKQLEVYKNKKKRRETPDPRFLGSQRLDEREAGPKKEGKTKRRGSRSKLEKENQIMVNLGLSTGNEGRYRPLRCAGGCEELKSWEGRT